MYLTKSFNNLRLRLSFFEERDLNLPMTVLFVDDSVKLYPAL